MSFTSRNMTTTVPIPRTSNTYKSILFSSFWIYRCSPTTLKSCIIWMMKSFLPSSPFSYVSSTFSIWTTSIRTIRIISNVTFSLPRFYSFLSSSPFNKPTIQRAVTISILSYKTSLLISVLRISHVFFFISLFWKTRTLFW